MSNKWDIPGWGAAQLQVREAVHFLCEGKDRAERTEIAEELVEVIRAIARGDKPPERTHPLYDGREVHFREVWARMVANNLVGAALGASERVEHSGPPPSPDQTALLREIARLALWHMPNAPEEARQLVRSMEIERLKQPHPADSPTLRVWAGVWAKSVFFLKHQRYQLIEEERYTAHHRRKANAVGDRRSSQGFLSGRPNKLAISCSRLS
jgi:hypothetical protein